MLCLSKDICLCTQDELGPEPSCWTNETKDLFRIALASYCVDRFGQVCTGGANLHCRYRHFPATRPSFAHREENNKNKPAGSTFLTTACPIFLRLRSPFFEDTYAVAPRKGFPPTPAGDMERRLVPVVSRPHLAGLVCGLEDVIVTTVGGWMDRPESETCQAMLPPYLQVRH